MATIEDYWILLPSANDTSIYTELQSIVRQKTTHRFSSPETETKTLEFLCRCLRTVPVTTCKLLHFLPSSICDAIYHSILLDLLNDIDTFDQNHRQFLAILLNGQWSAEFVGRFESEIFPRLVNHLTTTGNQHKHIDRHFRLCLAFFDDDKLREQFFVVNDRLFDDNAAVTAAIVDDLMSKRRFFEFVVVKRQHFLNKLIHLDGTARSMVTNDVLRQTLCAVDMLQHNLFTDCDKRFVEDIDSQSMTANPLRLNLFNELQRLLNLNELFALHIPAVQLTSTYASKFNVIDILCEHLNLALVDTEPVMLSMLQTNRKYNQRFDKRVMEGIATKSQLTESELFDQFLVVKLLLDVIMDNQQVTVLKESSVTKLNKVNVLLERIHSIEQLTTVLEIGFSLLFIRWDNMTQNVASIEDTDRIVDVESGSESCKSRKSSNRPEKTAFICSAVVLENILNLLKTTVVTRNTYPNVLPERDDTDDTIRNSFLRLYGDIMDAHWRMTTLSSADSTTNNISGSNRSTSFVSDDIRKYFIKHKAQARNITSGGGGVSSDDNDEHNNTSNSQSNAASSVYRKRPRKRNPLRKSTDDKNLVISNSTEQEQKSDSLYRSVSGSERRCPVSRMLGSSRHLATVCLNNGNFEATREIVEANNLDNSVPAKELQFMANYNQTKEKLRSVCEKCDTIDTTTTSIASNSNASSTVERLKHIATIGFEASQAQSIITTFAAENEYHLSTDDARNLIRKLHRQYPFLEMFNATSLQATIAVDLIISLTNSYEMYFNIFNMLTKLWTDPRWLEDPNDTTIGYLNFTKNICECLQLYKTIANVQFGVRELICNECYVLVPAELKVKLDRERVMQSVQSLAFDDIDTVAKLKTLLKPMDSLRGDVNYFGRSYHFIVNLVKLLTLRGDGATKNANPMDVIETDLCEVIGDIVFVNERLPGDIVEIVDNLNVNFVYVLCRNMMPTIPCCEPNDQAVTDSLIGNLRNGNLTDDTKRLPSTSPKEKRLHSPSTNVLNFLKKNNSLIAYLVQQECNDVMDGATVFYEQKFMKNFMALDDVKTVAMMHGDGLLLSALSYDTFDASKLERYLEEKEDCINAIRIIQSSSEQSLKIKGDRLKTLQDVLIARQLNDINNENHCDLIEQITDVHVKSKHLLDSIILSIESSDKVKRLIRSILLHKNALELNESVKVKLNEWLRNIQIYETLMDRMSCGSWIEAREISKNSSESILKCLMNAAEFDLCLTWLTRHPLAECTTKFTLFTDIFREQVLATTTLNRSMFKIIETLPLTTILQFYDALLNELRNLELLNYVTEFLIANAVQPFIYQRHRISLRIFNQMTEDEQDSNWMLFNTPLVIIEQYLMNSRHDAISTILNRIRPILSNEPCKYCYSRRNSSYDAKGGSDPDFKISLSGNDFGHCDHSLSRHCIDSLLKTYASKALDFRVSETHSHSSNELLTHSMASLDSLCGSYVMPKMAPDRLHWIKDEEASHCMCCRRSAFTMFCRRHHCRRCGRVVCHVCSTKRIEIPELYCDVQVRSCDDCYRQINQQSTNQRESSNVSSTIGAVTGGKNNDGVAVWHFSGNRKHDNLLREEFCFEYAPSVSLCLSILQFYSSDGDCVNFLLYHCQKFESLLRPIQSGYPNPEIDYALVTRMMHCLALAAKVRGGPPECDTIRDHGEIIQSIVHHGCESLMPLEPPNSSSFRTLRDSLVLAEKWSLALELSLKCGFATTGVLAAWGIACLRAGCFDTAREKFSHCLTKNGTDDETFHLTALLLQDNTDEPSTEWMDIGAVKRPTKSPPLLDEIVSILDATCRINHQPEVIARASIIKDSNTSLASTLSKRREKVPLHEPALNVMHTLSSLKKITRGLYDERRKTVSNTSKKLDIESTNGRKKLIRSSRFYDECLYYLTRYGSHNSILSFLIKNDQLGIALKYFLHQSVDVDSFINVIFLPFLRSGKVDRLINRLMVMDDTLLVWKEVIIKTCCYLEHKSLLNSLYHLQILLKDPIRASMTCVKFYSMNCSTYVELQNNSFHLINAQKHLQTELEICQWEEIPSVPNNVNSSNDDSQSILMKMDSRTLNSHINTIWRQIEVTKFLSKCEQNGCDTVALLGKITVEFSKIPTLFGTLQEKIQLAVLTIIAGSNINAGFGLAFRIIQDFNLKPIKVYGITAKYLSGHDRLNDVEKLIENMNSNSDSESALCDEIISLSIHTAVAASSPLNAPVKQLLGQTIESLLRYVTDIGIKISCHIVGGQLKSAYLLAVQYNRFNDVRKVLRKAEQTNQQYIKKLCEKKLNIH